MSEKKGVEGVARDGKRRRGTTRNDEGQQETTTDGAR